MLTKRPYHPHQNRRPRDRWVDTRGYVQIAMGGSSHQLGEHIWIAQFAIGRLLEPNEMVHHIDGNRSNNDPLNLDVMTRRKHAKTHKLGGVIIRKKEVQYGHIS